MEFAIVNVNYDLISFASTPEMRLLFTYVCNSSMETYDMEVEDYIRIYDAYDDDDSFFVTIKKDKLIEITRQWDMIRKKKPKLVFIKKEGEGFKFEGSEYEPRKIDQVNLNNVDIESSDIFNKSEKIFDGGFHYLPKGKDKDFELINKYSDKKGIITSDVRLKEDFTVNHSFFPEDWSVDKIKKKVLESITDLAAKKYVEIEDKIFSIYGYTDEAITVQAIIDDKGKILTAYPIFKKEQQ